MRIRPVLALVIIGAVLASGCAHRLSHEELLAAEGASTPAAVAITETGPVDGESPQGAVDEAGGATQSVAPSDGSSAGGTGAASGARPAAAPGSGVAESASPSCSGPRETLTIGSVGHQSGFMGAVLGGTVQMMQAWVASVNAGGGVNCHQLRYLVKDDHGDPATHQALVRELVEQHKVIALVMVDAPITGRSSLQYLTEKGVPVIGTAGGEDWYYESPVFRPQITTGSLALEGIVYALAKVGIPQNKRNLGTLTCIEVALCSSLYEKAGQLAQDAGLRLVWQAQVSLFNPTDFRSHCQQAKDRNVELFFTGVDTNSIQRLLAACDSIDYHPIYATGGILVTPALLDDPRATGFLIAPGTPLFTDTSVPGIVEMLQVLRQFAPGVRPSAPTAVGWAAAMLFKKVLDRTAEPVTREGILQAFGTIKDDDLGGLGPPQTFVPGRNATPVNCFWIGQVTAERSFGPVEGVPKGRICV